MFTDNRCANRVITGAALGATVGGAVGAVYGTYESFAYKVRRRYLYFLARDSFPTADPARRRPRTDAGGTANLTVSHPRASSP